MGTGKTEIALGIIHVLYKERNAKRVLVTAPGMVLPKWVQEIRQTIPYAKVRVLRCTKDALRLAEDIRSGVKPDGLEIVMVGIDRAKLGPEPWPGAVWKRVKGERYHSWHCPDCGGALPSPEILQEYLEELEHDAETLPEIYASWGDMALEPAIPPRNGQKTTITRCNRQSKLKKCPHCGTRLWRPASVQRSETRMKSRWFICRILKKLGKVFDLYIADEVHQTKEQNSGRGYAFGQMVKCAGKVIGLTGTLTNGKSTSIKEILWRTDPLPLITEGFDYKTGNLKWAARYGTIERRVYKDKPEDSGIITVRRSAGEKVTEKPGVSPELTATYLLDRSVFLELGDIGLPLVELKEIPVILEMDAEHKKTYRSLHDELYETCRKQLADGKAGAFAALIPTTINYADRPDMGVRVWVGDDAVAAPEFEENYYHSKERKLVEIVQSELAENRGVVVYTKYTNKYDINSRLKKVLNDHGIEACVLDACTSQEDRMRWLAEKEKAGVRVIIANLKLVETGLDLLPWPTLIYYQLDYEVNAVRQSGRRAWRIGQTRECRNYYLVYNESQQLAQFKHIMAGRGHAMFVEGRLDRSELAEYAMDHNTTMAYTIAQCLASADLADKWTRLAEKDIDQKLLMVSEKEFLVAVEEAKKKLVAETLRMCGKSDAEIDELVGRKIVRQDEQVETDIADEPETEDSSIGLLVSSDRNMFLDLENGVMFPGYGILQDSKKTSRRRRRQRSLQDKEFTQLSIFMETPAV